MDFYSDVAPYYDLLFPLGEDKVSFFRGLFERRRPILDLACGSGRLAARLAADGFSVVGMDNEAAFFTARTPDDRGPGPMFVAGDMTSPPFARGGVFGGVICIGNSLPHLRDMNEVENLIRDCADILAPGGEIVLQLMDFAALRGEGEMILPDLHARSGGTAVTLRRRYVGGEREAFFRPRLVIGGREREYSIRMCPIEHEELCACLRRAGFTIRETFSDFRRGEWRGQSGSYIVVAAKVGGP
jgi:SAM-dependent methyltransferase